MVELLIWRFEIKDDVTVMELSAVCDKCYRKSGVLNEVRVERVFRLVIGDDSDDNAVFGYLQQLQRLNVNIVVDEYDG